jgi:hypothetical protein
LPLILIFQSPCAQLAEAILSESETPDNFGGSICLSDRRTFGDTDGHAAGVDSEERERFLVGGDDENEGHMEDRTAAHRSPDDQEDDESTPRQSILQNAGARLSRLDIHALAVDGAADETGTEPDVHTPKKNGLSAKAGIILVRIYRQCNVMAWRLTGMFAGYSQLVHRVASVRHHGVVVDPLCRLRAGQVCPARQSPREHQTRQHDGDR